MSVHEFLIRFHGIASRVLVDALDLEVEENTSPEATELVEESRFHAMRKHRKKPVREGRADTGHAVFGKDGLKSVSINHFVEDLLAQGYKVANLYAEQKFGMKNGKATHPKVVATIVFSKSPDTEDWTEDNPDPTDEIREILKTYAAEKCHVWRNHYNDTINVTGVEAKAKDDLRIGPSPEQTYSYYPTKTVVPQPSSAA